MRLSFKGLWRHPDFLKLWSGQTISLFGSQITFLALPITAALVLQATPAQMGFLAAAEMAPSLLVGLFAGVWVDRLRRRFVMVSADIARGLLLGIIPIAVLFNFLGMPLLYALGFLLGVFNFLFDVAYRSYLPSLVKRNDLMEANAKLEVTNSLAYIAGPGLAGWLVDVLSAPIAIAADAVSFFLSAFAIGSIKKPEAAPEPGADGQTMGREIMKGVRLILKEPILRAMAFGAMTSNFAGGFYSALLVLYITRELGFSALFFGFMYGAGSLSGMLSAVIIKRIQKHVGVGPTFIYADIMIGLGWLLIPVLSWGLAAPRLVIIGCMLVAGFGNTTCNITSTSLAQAVVPFRLLGRYNATDQFIALGLLPIGSLIGGALGTAIGVRGGLIAGGCVMMTSFLWPLFSPLRSLRKMPEEEQGDNPASLR